MKLHTSANGEREQESSMPFSRYKYFRNAIAKRRDLWQLWLQDTQKEQNPLERGHANIEAVTQMLNIQQYQHILSHVVVVIPGNAFKYLLQSYLADDNEIAGKYTWKKMEISCTSLQGSYQA